MSSINSRPLSTRHTSYYSRRGSDDQSYYFSCRSSDAASSSRTAMRCRAIESSKASSPPLPDIFSPEWDSEDVTLRYGEGREAWDDVQHVLQRREHRARRTSEMGRRGSASSEGSVASLITSTSFSSSPPTSILSTPLSARTAYRFPESEPFTVSAAGIHAQASRRGGVDEHPAGWRASVFSDDHLLAKRDEDEGDTPKPRSRSSALLRSLNLPLSRRKQTPSPSRSPPVSPSKRLAPLARYNPFMRTRSESLSSVIEEDKPTASVVGESAELVRPRTGSTTSGTLGRRVALPNVFV
ncbi:hypothetical protein DENSPDRAFT_364895 [Dentipellis sp. KUC8613]|nr:hypothetical protein DENSPDRAFT_364895 [Dentipellis sp. KUC8613]